MPPIAALRAITIFCLIFMLGSCNKWGDKVSKDYLEVYYKDGITKAEATKTLDLLYPVWKSQDSTPDIKKSVQLTRNADTVNFRMVINPGKMAGIGDEVILQMANEFSVELYDGKPVNVDLADNKFKTIRTLHFVKQDPAAAAQ